MKCFSHRYVQAAIGFAGCLLATALWPARGFAQLPGTCDANRWSGAPRFTGTITVTANANGTTPAGEQFTLSQSVNAVPDMPLGQFASYGWSGTLNAHVVYHFNDVDVSGGVTTTDVDGPATDLIGNPAKAAISIDPYGCTYTIVFDAFANATITHSGSGTPSQVTVAWVSPPAQAIPLPASGDTLTGSVSTDDVTSLPGIPIHETVTWSLSPGEPSVDLVVRIPALDTWRPTAGLNEQETGLDARGAPNLLLVQAVLLNADGSPSLVVPEQIVFTFSQVSHEPGVAMNLPDAGSATADPDLTFDPNGSRGATITGNGTVATFTNLLYPVTAIVAVAPHDWGAWAVLNVTATVNGTPVQGHLEGDTTAIDIRLPDRDHNSHIANIWKTARGVSRGLADSFDGEKTPNNSYDGDGLTLYEEYRGFYVNCPSGEVSPSQCRNGGGHIEGYPDKKDLFVVVDPDLAGEVDPGILNFAAKSKLKVHYSGMTLGNISGDRVINFNHAEGAHAVDQHAVTMVVNSVVVGCTLGGPGTPADIKEIRIPHRASLIAAAQQAGRSASQIAIYRSAYPQMVAHELGHAVDISHHGEIDAGGTIWSTSDDVTITETITRLTPPHISNITVLTEAGHALGPADLGITRALPLELWVGITGGQHSGDTDCFMRYMCSMAYISSASDAIRYYAQEQPGFNLTNNAAGTGVNSSTDHPSPQPRYGDAVAPRGLCQEQLCVNDLLHIAPISPRQLTCPQPARLPQP